jgi:hypothetical protein
MMHETSGSASLWSDGRRTYVLLFNGGDREMGVYMATMGIDTYSQKNTEPLGIFHSLLATLRIEANNIRYRQAVTNIGSLFVRFRILFECNLQKK